MLRVSVLHNTGLMHEEHVMTSSAVCFMRIIHSLHHFIPNFWFNATKPGRVV
uniref:Uncharacterized protein n=1 Tax=Anguilla anguilla TaxID=7936 RepID=A0A0E9SCY1_ANGAN